MTTISPLRRDATDLYAAATAFIRLYQFRDRNQALRFGLTVVQAYTIDLLVASGTLTLTNIAAALRLDKSTMSRAIAGMARRGLVAWSRAPDDARVKAIVATAEGRRRYVRLRDAIIADNARLLAAYTPGQRRAIVSSLRQLAERSAGTRKKG
jgi:DNA-binding MarR family transcriptional regulator